MMTGNAFLLLDDGYTRTLLFMIMYTCGCGRYSIGEGGHWENWTPSEGGRTAWDGGFRKGGVCSIYFFCLYLATKLHFWPCSFQLHLLFFLPWCVQLGVMDGLRLGRAK
jgi:hypothetical protein